MDKIKLEDFKCGYCHKIPEPGDGIYRCNPGCCYPFNYRCQTCCSKGHSMKQFKYPAQTFQSELTKLVSAYFAPPCNETLKHDYFCSNSKNGCQEEFLAQKAHEKSCIYQEVSCPSINCKEVTIFKDVDDHMEQSHNLLKVNKEWNFNGTEQELNEIICQLSSYDQKFFPQVFVKDKNLYFKVIMVDQQVNTIPFDVSMTFYLKNGKNISMKDSVFSVMENDKENKFLNVSLDKITQYLDAKHMSLELKCQSKIDFCLKIVNEKLDEIAKHKNENEESGNIF